MKKVYFELESLDKIHEAARYFLNAVEIGRAHV